MKRYNDCNLTLIVSNLLNCSSLSSLLLKTGAETPLGNGYFIAVNNNVILLENMGNAVVLNCLMNKNHVF